jgi:N-carbamoylputrescine amidase
MQHNWVSVGLVQHAMGLDRAGNVERSIAGIREASERGAQLVCLPELFASTYFCQVADPAFFDWAEPLDGPTVRAVSAVAKECNVSVLTGIFERRTAGLYHNTLLAIGPDGETQGVYRKTHIPDDPQFHEKFYFTQGDLGFKTVQTQGAEVGMLVCWDQWFPEAARLTAMAGAQILFYPTAIGWLPEEKAQYGAEQLSAWQTMQRSHAIANGVFVVAVNRTGTEVSSAGEIEFWGHSFVAGPSGSVLGECGVGEQTLVVRCDLAQIEETRRIWPFFRDRRVDLYGPLATRWTGSQNPGAQK